MFCRNCGKQMPDDAKFCGNCGTPVTEPAQPWTPATEPEAASAEPAAEAPAAEPAAEAATEAPAAEPATEAPAAEPATEATAAESAAEATAAEPAMEATAAEPATEAPAAEPATEAPAAEPATEATAAEPAEAAKPVKMPQFDIPFTPPQGPDGPEQPPAKRRGKAAVFAVLGVGAVAVIAVVVLLVRLLMGLAGGGSKGLYVYLTDDGELMYLSALKEGAKTVEITDEANNYADVEFSSDGKTIYFRDKNGSLYRIAVADLEKENGKPERISRNVNSYEVLDKGRLVYGEWESGSGFKVSLYEDGQSNRLVKSCDEWYVSEDGKSLYYFERESDGNNSLYTLYRMELGKDGKTERLLKDYNELWTDHDAETLVYVTQEKGQQDPDTGRVSGNTLTVYSCKPGEKGTKLVSDVYRIQDVTSDSGKVNFYYVKEDVDKATLYDFVTDNLASQDAKTLQESQPEYPSWYGGYYPERAYVGNLDSYPTGEYWRNWQWYYENAKGDSYPLDSSQVIDSILAYYNNYNIYEIDIRLIMNRCIASLETPDPVWNLMFADAQARYEAAEQDYYDRYEEWSSAQRREYIREGLKGTRYDQVTYSLYQYTGEKEKDPIATNLRNGYFGGTEGIFVYRKADSVGKGKVADVSDLDYASQVYDYMDSGDGDTDVYVNVGGKESVLDIDEEDSFYGLYKVSDKEVLLYVNDGYEDRLDSYTIGSDSIKRSDTIYEGEFSIAGIEEESGGKYAVYLFTELEEDNNSNNDLGDFCVYRNGKLETIAKEVYAAFTVDKDGTTYVVTDVDRKDNGELAVLKDGKPATISDEMNGRVLTWLSGGQLLYTDADKDLYLWDGKESRRIDRDVEKLWTNNEESVSMYGPGYDY